MLEKNKIILKDNNPGDILEAYKNLDSLIKNDICKKNIENYYLSRISNS